MTVSRQGEENDRKFRRATEFLDQEGGGATDSGQPHRFLRVLRDGNGDLRAGLYDTGTPDIDDHWAKGETITDPVDARLAARALPYEAREQAELLLGLAYQRLWKKRHRAPLHIRVPTSLTQWTVRMPVARDGGAEPTLIHVMASSRKVAEALGPLMLLEQAAGNANASSL